MKSSVSTDTRDSKNVFLNLAFAGGGERCKLLLEVIPTTALPYLNLNIIGVFDAVPDAKGRLLAEKMGIFTTDNIKELCNIKGLDGIVDIANDNQILSEIILYKPEKVALIEYNTGKWLREIFEIKQRIESEEQQVILETLSSDFLIQKSTAAIIVLNPDFTIFDINEVFLQELQKTKDDIIGSYCYEISHGLKEPCFNVSSELPCPVIETLQTGKSAHAIHDHSSYDTNAHFCNLVTYPIKNQDGEIIRIIKIKRDITEAVSERWEKKIRALKEDMNKLIQEDRMISLGKLVASSAHEINNPIQGLLTFSHLIQKILSDDSPDKKDIKMIRKHVALMSQELERCGNIVSGLLSFARESPVEYLKTDLNEVLEAVTALVHHKMALHNIALSINLSPVPVIINGDANQLQQCFLNLIFNAIEAMNKGGKITVKSKFDPASNKSLVEIHDTGSGISDEHVDHIFDPFFTTKQEGEGTGLGLSIVYGVIKNHRGSINVESHEGKGSSFILAFPTQ